MRVSRNRRLFENRQARPLSPAHFGRRVAKHTLLGGAVLMGSLFAGMVGYAYFEQLSWLDAFLNASMLLGGMGPVDAPQTPGGKLFAGLYALYSGLVFLVVGGVVLAPFLHRLLHRFHWDDDQASPEE